MRNIYRFFLLSFILLLMLSCSNDKAIFNGTWTHEKLEQTSQGGFLKRKVEIKNNECLIQIDVFADSEYLSPIYHYKTSGVIETKKDDEKTNAVIILNEQYLKLLTDNPTIINSYGFHYCEIKKDEAVNISEQGCAFILPIEKLKLKPPLIRIEDGNLLIANNIPLQKI